MERIINHQSALASCVARPTTSHHTTSRVGFGMRVDLYNYIHISYKKRAYRKKALTNQWMSGTLTGKTKGRKKAFVVFVNIDLYAETKGDSSHITYMPTA